MLACFGGVGGCQCSSYTFSFVTMFVAPAPGVGLLDAIAGQDLEEDARRIAWMQSCRESRAEMVRAVSTR